MKILITGGAGYLGSIMTPQLLNAGHKVTVLDSFMFNQTSLLDCCINPDLTIVRGDTRDKALMEKLVKDADAIFPLACLTGAPLCAKEPRAAEEIILDAVKMILEMSNKEQMIIYPTTNSGYGVGEKGIHCTEETPLRPVSLYGKLKVAAEKAILDSGHGITLRLATAFGVSPRMRLDLLVNDFTYRAVYDRFIVLFEANFKRNFIHVRDIANAFIHSLNNFETMKNGPYNVGLSDANLNKEELCKEIKKHVSDFYFVEASIGEDPDKRDYIVSNEKIEKTGFKQQVSLSAGIAELVKGYQIIKRNQYSNI
ncbi:UDP-glucose 4-epimerase [hydrothermal vent metagenome]|uniref:UDP-glucose 4-epimerase n=1 Tax=hydrothermal vent metagenome TaxID=652676 RepID=A0A3B1DLN9_9ZZZZ